MNTAAMSLLWLNQAFMTDVLDISQDNSKVVLSQIIKRFQRYFKRVRYVIAVLRVGSKRNFNYSRDGSCATFLFFVFLLEERC